MAPDLPPVSPPGPRNDLQMKAAESAGHISHDAAENEILQIIREET